MKTYCLVCKENTHNINSKVIKTKNDRLLLLSKGFVCKNRKGRLISKNEQQANKAY